MLIDSTHTKWCLATAALGGAAVATYVWLDRATPGGLTGGSNVGLSYGIAAALLMIYAGLLGALRKVPGWWWLGARRTWLRGHIWLGLLSFALALCHSGFRWGGLLEKVLWVILGATVLTGVCGLLLQQFLPRLIMTRTPNEAPYDQIPHLCRVMNRKAEELLDAIWKQGPKEQASIQYSQEGIGAMFQFQEFYEKHVRPFLAEKYERQSMLADPLQAEEAFARLRALPGLVDAREEVDAMESLCRDRRQLADLERLYLWLHGWLLIHVPLSVALLVLGTAHAIFSLYY